MFTRKASGSFGSLCASHITVIWLWRRRARCYTCRSPADNFPPDLAVRVAYEILRVPSDTLAMLNGYTGGSGLPSSEQDLCASREGFKYLFLPQKHQTISSFSKSSKTDQACFFLSSSDSHWTTSRQTHSVQDAISGKFHQGPPRLRLQQRFAIVFECPSFLLVRKRNALRDTHISLPLQPVTGSKIFIRQLTR